MAKKQEATQTDPKSGVPICPYCKMNMRNVGTQFGIQHYVCKQEGCRRGDAKRKVRSAPAYDNEGFSARP